MDNLEGPDKKYTSLVRSVGVYLREAIKVRKIKMNGNFILGEVKTESQGKEWKFSFDFHLLFFDGFP